MTIVSLIWELTSLLLASDISDAPFEAKQIVLSVFGLDSTGYLLHRADRAEEGRVDAAFRLAERRVAGEPLQYLLGVWSFLDESFFVGPGVLIPRPETEELVLLCQELLTGVDSPVIFDLCAGSGCIGLSLLKRVKNAHLISFELSEEALVYLHKNAENLGLTDRVQIIHGNVLRGLSAFGALPKADLIVSNPPYIPSSEIASLQREVQMEPRLALDGGEDGLTFYRCFASQWGGALKPDGRFAFECAEGQGAAISDLLRASGCSAEIRFDFNGFDRFVLASRSRKDPL